MKGLKLILDLLYPKRCPICENIVIPKGNLICRACYEGLPFVKEPCCAKCGKPLGNMEKEYCYDCEKRTFHYERGYGLWTYDKQMKNSISAFKYRGKREYADFFGQQLLLRYETWIRFIGIEVIIPVPIHSKKLRTRGYNQAGILAEIVGAGTNLPVEEVLERCINTRPQKVLDNRERIYNLQNAFRINSKKNFCVKGKKILLIDDIYTTGSTIEVCTNALLKEGAEKVYFLCLCIGKGY